MIVQFPRETKVVDLKNHFGKDKKLHFLPYLIKAKPGKPVVVPIRRDDDNGPEAA